MTSGVSETTSVTPEQLAAAAKKFDAVNQDLTSTLKNLMDRLSILNSTWKGQAAVKFEEVKTRYAQDLTDLNRALADTAEAIRVSGVSYDASDSDAAARVTQSGGGGYKLPL